MLELLVSEPAAIAARIRRWEDDGPQGPMTLELYPTLKCNLDCAFCDTTERHQPRQDELPLERHIQILDEAAELGVKRVFVLGGGEPLVARDLTPAILHHVKSLGMEGILTTNGTILPRSLREQLLEDAWDEIHVSVDGPTPEIHDALRGMDGAFNKTVGNLCRLNMARRARGRAEPRLALHFVITNTNFHTLPAMVRLGHALGCFRIDFDALIAYRPEQLALKLSPEQASRVPGIAAQALELANRLGIATTLDRYLSVEALDRGDNAPEPTDAEGLAGAPCLKAWHYLVVQSDGRTSPCCVLAGQGESVAETSLEDVWRDGAFLNRVRDGMLAKKPLPRCAECSPNILAHEREIRSHL
ncbi:MAG: radical SAM protein [Proteobacteria bacterium]|nr:radical SAM protein [Pseudomonadota bacterium]MCP4917329.1 radical SAM protein [Pseudomonadota bacterium]